MQTHLLLGEPFRNCCLVNGSPLLLQFLLLPLDVVPLHIPSTHQNTLQSTETKIIVRLTRQLLVAKFEKRYNLGGQFLSRAESLGVEHDLSNELDVRFGHGKTAEQLFQVVREVGAAGVARVHGDEDGHVGIHFHCLPHQLHSDRLGARDCRYRVSYKRFLQLIEEERSSVLLQPQQSHPQNMACELHTRQCELKFLYSGQFLPYNLLY